MRMKRIMICDCGSLLHSVKFSMGKGKLSHNDKPTFVLYGFLLKLQFLMTKIRPDLLVFAVDSPNSKRKKIFAAYKEKRHKNKTEEQSELDTLAYPQFEEVKNYILPKLGYKNVFSEDGLEADDIIGSICKTYTDHEIVIVSNDGDLYQLLTDRVCMFDPSKNQYFSEDDFEKKYNMKPEMWKRVKVFGGCFDSQTEILTNRGWLYFSEVRETDEVYSMNPNTRIAKYEKIKSIIKYKYSGNMYKIKGTLTDLLVTPNHKFFGSTTQSYPTEKSRNVVRFKEIQEIVKYDNFTIPISSIFEGKNQEYFNLPSFTVKFTGRAKNGTEFKKEIEKPEIKIKMDVWLAFLGIWLADGYVSKNRNGKIGTVGICKVKEIPVQKMQEILNKTPWKWLRVKNEWKLDNVQLANYLHEIGDAYSKHIPQEFKDLSVENLQILIDSMMIGDGCVSSSLTSTFGSTYIERVTKSYCSSSKKLIDDFQDIVSKCGNSSTITKRESRNYTIRGKSGISKPSYVLKFNKSNNLNLMNKKVSLIPFNDYVYDVETEPNHTIFVRRNGHVCWSSNCTTDEVPGIRVDLEGDGKITTIGKDSAIKYAATGIIPDKKLKALNSEEGKKQISRNKSLVILPFSGTPTYRIDSLSGSKNGLKEVAQKYGFKSILGDLNNWNRILRLY